jgi:hypothetical protein
MACARCGGLVVENWWDLVDEASQKWLQGTRCVNCGAIDDLVILANRLRPHPARITAPGAAGMGKAPVPSFQHSRTHRERSAFHSLGKDSSGLRRM